MLVLLAVLATGLLLLWGAYRLGQRSAFAALTGTALLIPLAWRLSQVDTSHGEGAAAGVAVVVFLVWSLTALSILLAVAMLVGAIRGHDSLVAKVALGLVILLTTIAVMHRPVAGTAPAPGSSSTTEPRSPHLEGYAWAIDEGVMADSSCHGDSAFVAGCRAGVARNRDH